MIIIATDEDRIIPFAVFFVIEPGHDGNIILYPADFFTILARWKVFHIGINRCRQAGVHIAGRLAVGRPEVIFKRQDPSRRGSIGRLDRLGRT